MLPDDADAPLPPVRPYDLIVDAGAAADRAIVRAKM
jgi:hypothetical protein